MHISLGTLLLHAGPSRSVCETPCAPTECCGPTDACLPAPLLPTAIFEILAYRVVEADLENGLTTVPFPSRLHTEILKRYALRYGIRDVFRHLVYVESNRGAWYGRRLTRPPLHSQPCVAMRTSVFRIVADHLVNVGQLEIKVVLSLALNVHTLLRRTVGSLNNTEVPDRAASQRTSEQKRRRGSAPDPCGGARTPVAARCSTPCCKRRSHGSRRTWWTGSASTATASQPPPRRPRPARMPLHSCARSEKDSEKAGRVRVHD